MSKSARKPCVFTRFCEKMFKNLVFLNISGHFRKKPSVFLIFWRPRQDSGGTAAGGLGYGPFKLLSKNPLEIPKGIPS